MNAKNELGPDALDFWIGDWTVSWPDGTGTNQIRRILDDRVVEEVFECHAEDGALYGRSLSVLDTADGLWKQTWVDSSECLPRLCRSARRRAHQLSTVSRT